MPHIVLLVRKLPYRTSHIYELTRIGQALAGVDLPTTVIFSEEGLFCLLQNQNPTALSMESILINLQQLKKYGATFYVIQESLTAQGLQPHQLMTNFDLQFISRSTAAQLIHKAKFTLEV